MAVSTDRISERSRRRRRRRQRRNFADSIASRGRPAEEATNCAPGDIETSREVARRERLASVPPLTLVEINYSENKDSHPSRVIARLQVADRLQVQRAITSAFDNYSRRRGSTANT